MLPRVQMNTALGFYAAALLAAACGVTLAQTPAPQAAGQATTAQAPAVAGAPQMLPAANEEPAVSTKDQRRAAKLYFAATKLFEKEQFEEAMRVFEEAATLDPANPDYKLAVEVARNHTATALVQEAAKDRIRGDAAGARAALAHALEL